MQNTSHSEYSLISKELQKVKPLTDLISGYKTLRHLYLY